MRKKDTFFTHQQKNVLIVLLVVTSIFSLLLGFVKPPSASITDAAWLQSNATGWASSNNIWDRAAGAGIQQTSQPASMQYANPSSSQSLASASGDDTNDRDCQLEYRKYLTAVQNYDEHLVGMETVIQAYIVYAKCASISLDAN